MRRPVQRDPDRLDPTAYRESAELSMLYRAEIEFAVGHGVSVEVEQSADDPERATLARTCWLPSHDVPQQTPPSHEDKGFEGLKGLELDMKVLAGVPDGEFAEKLQPLLDAITKDVTARATAAQARMMKGMGAPATAPGK